MIVQRAWRLRCDVRESIFYSDWLKICDGTTVATNIYKAGHGQVKSECDEGFHLDNIHVTFPIYHLSYIYLPSPVFFSLIFISFFSNAWIQSP